jgi:hypothetical protein
LRAIIIKLVLKSGEFGGHFIVIEFHSIIIEKRKKIK